LYLPSPLLFSPLILLTNNSSVTHLQKALDKPNGLSYDDLIETTRILIVGGAETTATLLTGLIFYLLNPSPTSTSPSPLTKLTTLLRQTFPSPSQITPSTLHSPPLLYLTACINEGLRLFPPLPGNLRRIVPKDGKVISGRWVPGGTLVAVDILAANLSRENFALPDNFCPERWLGEERKGNLFEGGRGEVVKPVSSSLSILGWKGSEEMLMMLE
jgi:cytochrome P450